MTTIERINDDLVSARKKKAKALSSGSQLDADTLATIDTLSLVSSLLMEAETRKKHREPLSESETIAELQKIAKQRRKTAEQYDNAGRSDRAEMERAEAAVVESYLPMQKSAEETEALIDRIIREIGATSMSDMGKIMGKLSADDTIDKKLASSIVRARLS